MYVSLFRDQFEIQFLISYTIEQIESVWEMFNWSLNLPDHTIRTTTFRELIRYLFPEPAKPSIPTQWFSVTIREIQKCGMEIKRTDNFLEHLDVEGDTVKILTVDSNGASFLWYLKRNLVAQ